MYERLYCPDFGPVFGNEYRRPFEFPMVDSLVWPVLEGEGAFNGRAEKLLGLEGSGHPLFYRRKINFNDLVNEMSCSGIGTCLVQAMDLGQGVNFGIPNELALRLSREGPLEILPVLSVDYSDGDAVLAVDGWDDRVAGVVVYPTFVKSGLNEGGSAIDELADVCRKRNWPLKIELGNTPLPGGDKSFVTPEEIDAFAHSHPDLRLILSGGDLGHNLLRHLNLTKYRRNVAVELDPRTIGGTTPRAFFSRVFSEPGVVQNCWDRILVGSATPTLESSQVVRGWWEATEGLPLAQRHLLRIWGFRNAHRWYNISRPSPRTIDLIGEKFASKIMSLEITAQHEEPPQFVRLVVAAKLQSFSITQLLWLQPLVDEIETILRTQFGEFKAGEVRIRTTHTTTSLVINEHEPGNFLELHYQVVKATMEPSDQFLHTVAAAENRADFNFPDHLAASSFGQRDVTFPYRDGKILRGGRENLYLLTTFGPRNLVLNISVKLEK
ncbi:MAG: YjbQ family protein [Promethearchaeota archaeon]